jgi:hypothetical protein
MGLMQGRRLKQEDVLQARLLKVCPPPAPTSCWDPTHELAARTSPHARARDDAGRKREEEKLTTPQAGESEEVEVGLGEEERVEEETCSSCRMVLYAAVFDGHGGGRVSALAGDRS